MTEAETPILRAEFATFQQEIRSDMREVRDGMVRADVKADQADKRMGSIEVQLMQGLASIGNDLRGLKEDNKSFKSIRVWVIGGAAAAGGAGGVTFAHSLLKMFS